VIAFAQVGGCAGGYFPSDFLLLHAALFAHYRIGVEKNLQICIGKNFGSDVPAFHHYAAAGAHRALMRDHPCSDLRMYRHTRRGFGDVALADA